MDDGAETHVGWTIGLAGATASAVIEMGLQARIGRELPRVERGDQRNASPWRFVFVRRELVGGAVLGTHTAHHAAVQFGRERLFCGGWGEVYGVCWQGHGQWYLWVTA
jgi:hypothetical protein